VPPEAVWTWYVRNILFIGGWVGPGSGLNVVPSNYPAYGRLGAPKSSMDVARTKYPV
jgi:hypothetical protein